MKRTGCFQKRGRTEDGCNSCTGRKDEAPAVQAAESRGGLAGKGHLYLVWAEDRADTVQHLFGVFSLGVPTDDNLSRVGGRREKNRAVTAPIPTAPLPTAGPAGDPQPQPIPV